ncbi:MAG: permease [Coriobacteriia bacterium]|nr:permease [Coriobacteriia bacterium]MBN2822351.1 permease [Coriobacteriia bacterium]
MDLTGIVYLAGVGIAYAVFWRRSPERSKKALSAGTSSFKGMLPTFIAVFGLVGLFDVFIPPALIERWMGSSSGALSLLVGTGLGTVAAGPPAAAYPIAATLLKNGAWAPAVAAFIVSWILVGFISLPMESKIFGARFAILRNGLSMIAAAVIGLLMGVVL